MIASTRSAPGILKLMCGTVSILMTLTGLLFLIGTRLLSLFTRSGVLVGEIDAMSVALIFGGIAVALKSIEIRLRAEQDSSMD